MFSRVFFVCPRGGLGGWGVGLHPDRGGTKAPSDTTGYSHQAGGTHPAGIHSCWNDRNLHVCTFNSIKNEVILSRYCTFTPLPTAREGNVFRSVCHSVHRGVYDVTSYLVPCSFRSKLSGPLFLPRGVCLLSRGSGYPPVLTSGCSQCSSRYASYWNAFLFT